MSEQTAERDGQIVQLQARLFESYRRAGHAKAAYAKLEEEADHLRGEVAMVDAVVARRPAVEGLPRLAAIELAFAEARKVDPLKAEVARLRAQVYRIQPTDYADGDTWQAWAADLDQTRMALEREVEELKERIKALEETGLPEEIHADVHQRAEAVLSLLAERNAEVARLKDIIQTQRHHIVEMEAEGREQEDSLRLLRGALDMAVGRNRGSREEGRS